MAAKGITILHLTSAAMTSAGYILISYGSWIGVATVALSFIQWLVVVEIAKALEGERK